MTPPQVFVAWDSQLHNVGHIFDHLEEHSTNPRVVILGAAGKPALGELRGKLAEEIGTSDALLAIVDIANANMTWELGFGLGLGLRVAIGTESPDAPWVWDTPLHALLRNPGLTLELAISLLSCVDAWPCPAAPPQRGKRRVLLCPGAGAGAVWRLALAKALPDWTLLDATGWKPSDLPSLLAAADRLAWVLVPLAPHEKQTRGHGTANAVGALVAGYAEAVGLGVKVFACDGAPKIADVAEDQVSFISGKDLPDKIRAWSAHLDTPDTTGSAVERAWRVAMRELHANPLAYVTRLGLADTPIVPIEVGLDEGDDIDRIDGSKARLGGPRTGHLEAWIQEDLEAGRVPRWLIRAEPGAGKTTLLRRLAHELAESERLPLFLSLADWEGSADDVFAHAARRATELQRGPSAEMLRAAAAARGKLWVLFDGFDEVRRPDEVRGRIRKFASDHPGAVVVVTSRASAVAGAHEWAGFRPATVRYLDLDQQRDLVWRLCGGDPGGFWTCLAERPGVAVLLRNPFLLTLAVGLHRRAVGDGRAPPADRVTLLRSALDDCLARGWGAKDGPADRGWDPVAARIVLRSLSLRLHADGAEAWTRDHIARTCLALHADHPIVATIVGPRGNTWPTSHAFLDQLGPWAGVLGPLDAADLPWRYLHRSLCEMLAAECLAEEMEAPAREAAVATMVGKDAARSAEVVSLLAALVPAAEAVRHLERLVETSGDAAVRALSSVERLEAWTHLSLLLRVKAPEGQAWRHVDWDNDQLDGVLDAIALGGRAGELWGAVDAGRSRFELGVLWYGLERVETWGRPERSWTEAEARAAAARFFGACGLADRPRPDVPGRPIPGGAFEMGSEEAEVERPSHPVSVSAFTLGETPITVAQLRPFDPQVKGRGELPATEVDWFSARLFAAWLGGRLPTEAEWEYACRAGTTAPWSCPERDLRRHAWFGARGEGRVHPVARKLANGFGLYDMHGNVWEWCADRVGPYAGVPVTNPSGPPSGSSRVLRGGSYWHEANWCRSASRGGVPPDLWNWDFGFRIVLPVP